MSAATPSTAPIWRRHEDSAVPVAIRFAGRSMTVAVDSAAKTMPAAAPETSWQGSHVPMKFGVAPGNVRYSR